MTVEEEAINELSAIKEDLIGQVVGTPPKILIRYVEAIDLAKEALRAQQEREKEPHGLLTAWETPESCPHCMEHLSLDWSYCPQCGRPTNWAPNEPLTLENGFDITNADGTPVDYDALGKKYKDQLCYCDIDGFYVGEDGQLVLMDDCGSAVWVDRGDYHITMRKPEGSDSK